MISRTLRYGLFPAIVAWAALVLPATTPAATCAGSELMPTHDNAPALRAATLCLLNEERAKRGLKALKSHPQLEKAAQNYTRAMVRQGFFDHVSPGGSTLLSRVRRGTRYLHGARRYSLGENIAWGSGNYATPRETVQGWMESVGPPHQHPQPPVQAHRHRRRRRRARGRSGHARGDAHHGLRVPLPRLSRPESTRGSGAGPTRLSRRCRALSRSEHCTTTPPSPARSSTSRPRPTTSSTPPSAPSCRRARPTTSSGSTCPRTPTAAIATTTPPPS